MVVNTMNIIVTNIGVSARVDPCFQIRRSNVQDHHVSLIEKSWFVAMIFSKGFKLKCLLWDQFKVSLRGLARPL